MLYCLLIWVVIIHSYATQSCIAWVNGDADSIRLSSQLFMLLLGHWNIFFNGFASSQLFYKTLKDLRILSWISYCLQEGTFPPSCFIFLFLYFCLFLHILSYLLSAVVSCQCALLLQIVSIFTFSQSFPFVCFCHPIFWFLLHVFHLSSCLLFVRQSYHFSLV